MSEQGVNVLFVAFGFLKWFEAEHSDEPRLSPLLLVPVCLERIGATAPWFEFCTFGSAGIHHRFHFWLSAIPVENGVP